MELSGQLSISSVAMETREVTQLPVVIYCFTSQAHSTALSLQISKMNVIASHVLSLKIEIGYIKSDQKMHNMHSKIRNKKTSQAGDKKNSSLSFQLHS